MNTTLLNRTWKSLLLAVIFTAILNTACDDESKPRTIPTVTTTEASEITGTTAMSGGTITDDGNATITASGLCYSSTNQTPTLEDELVNAAATDGVFTGKLEGLDYSTTYYVRAYATNSVGTAYGEARTFTTTGETVTFSYNGSDVTYGVIVSSVTGRKWLDRNLGATSAPSAYDDYVNFGDLFQWGRGVDGHQTVTWASTSENTAGINGTQTTLATAATAGTNKFILNSSDPQDWLTPQNNNLWQGTGGTNNPCPAGYRIPTMTEWLAETLTGSFAAAYTQLKLTPSGRRDGESGSFDLFKEYGMYWSSTTTTEGSISYANMLYFDGSSAGQGDSYRSRGMPCRCIKDAAN